MSKKAFLVVCSLMLLVPLMVLAGPEHDHSKADMTKMHGEMKTIEGTLVCKSCTLKKEAGARSDCKTNGCQSSLMTADGEFIDFLDNKYAKELNGHDLAGKEIKVTGTFFASAHTIDVESYTVDGKTKSWCDHCSAMDGCAMKK